jgi:hypothetical protein
MFRWLRHEASLKNIGVSSGLLVSMLGYLDRPVASAQSTTSVDPNSVTAADDAHARVRALDPFCKQIVGAGLRRSATFAGLVDELEHHNVIVYLSLDQTLPVRAALTFLVNTGQTTYVHVHIGPRLSLEEATAAMAHELRHALEIAGASRPVTSEHDLQDLYRSIGFGVGAGEFESLAARATEHQVRQELSISRRGE